MNNITSGYLSIVRIVEDTTADGPGFRTTVYAAGCSHRCAGCHNPATWNISDGALIEIGELAETLLSRRFADITFSGGDPLVQVDGFTELARIIKSRSNKTIWCYTGYTYEQVVTTPALSKILPYIDVLVDGPYVQELSSRQLPFRGSSNQRIIRIS